MHSHLTGDGVGNECLESVFVQDKRYTAGAARARLQGRDEACESLEKLIPGKFEVN
jgi:hypothetical protein